MVDAPAFSVKMVADEVLDFLASSPTPDQIVAFRFSTAVNDYLQRLMDKNSAGTITPDELEEFHEILRWEHMVNMLALRIQVKRAGKA